MYKLNESKFSFDKSINNETNRAEYIYSSLVSHERNPYKSSIPRKYFLNKSSEKRKAYLKTASSENEILLNFR